MEEPDTTARKFVLNQVMNKQKESPKDVPRIVPKETTQKPLAKLKPLQQIKPPTKQPKPKLTSDASDTTDTKKLKEELIESANVQKKLLNKARDELKTKKSTETVSSFNLPSPINNPWEQNFQLSPKFLLNRHYMASYAKYDNIASSRNVNAAINSYIKRKK